MGSTCEFKQLTPGRNLQLLTANITVGIVAKHFAKIVHQRNLRSPS
jgi:hypothetical protein